MPRAALTTARGQLVYDSTEQNVGDFVRVAAHEILQQRGQIPHHSTPPARPALPAPKRVRKRVYESYLVQCRAFCDNYYHRCTNSVTVRRSGQKHLCGQHGGFLEQGVVKYLKD